MKNLFKKIIIFILTTEAKLVLWKYKPKIVAITGSVGKTSTKDAVYAVISKISYARKSEKSFNSEIGVPLTILGCRNGWSNPFIWFENIFLGLWLFIWPHKYPNWLILEVGIDKPGDMQATASWLKTHAVIITAIGEVPVHVEFFDSVKNLVEEKSQLIKTLNKDGFLILNADDKLVLELKTKSKNRTITYGFNPEADVICSCNNISYGKLNEPDGINFKVDVDGKSLPVNLEKVFGKNHLYAALSALAFAFSFKLNMLNAIDALRNYDIPPGRMKLLKGINKTLIIDDTYNSSPAACEAALKILGEIKSQLNATVPTKPEARKIAVLGDMLELGKHTKEAHKNIGFIAKENSDIIITVGPRAQSIKEGAIEAGIDLKNIFEFSNSIEAKEFLKKFIKKNDLILIKGSQGMRMERIVGELILDQENKKKLIVRQEIEWLAKE